MTRGTWIRSTRRTRGFALLWAAQAAFWCALGAVVLTIGLSRPTSSGAGEVAIGLGIGLAALALGLALLRYALGCLRAGLRIDGDHVLIVNPLTRRRVPLAEVRGFRAGAQPAAVGNPTPGVSVELADGSAVRVWALAREGLVWNTERDAERWSATASELDELFAARRGWPRTSGARG